MTDTTPIWKRDDYWLTRAQASKALRTLAAERRASIRANVPKIGRFWRTIADDPDTISLTDTLTVTGISRDDYWCIHRHGMWPFAPVGFAATGRGGPDEPYYRRSEVDAWMERNPCVKAAQIDGAPRNAPDQYPDDAGERRAA